MSASEGEPLDPDGDDRSIAEQLDGITYLAGAALRDDEIETIDRAATALRIEEEIADDVHPAAVRLLNAQKELVIATAELPADADALDLTERAYEDVERALAGIAALDGGGQ